MSMKFALYGSTLTSIDEMIRRMSESGIAIAGNSYVVSAVSGRITFSYVPTFTVVYEVERRYGASPGEAFESAMRVLAKEYTDGSTYGYHYDKEIPNGYVGHLRLESPRQMTREEFAMCVTDLSEENQFCETCGSILMLGSCPVFGMGEVHE